ncbi:cobyrinate a,c-diamide synthase [Rhizobium sp. CG5]|uniref:cobyrinate a,c-diamide synthase n=1 Tax=Rhizobium sp. CG5 TaxID=2726076 RepID=UPI002033BA89|nr:cobyrinate a,c-diamide synthase [Rhizobium sp. CG5]MCM2474904.1 cobyrinate a,c-diamide synthase [Rhizobium sp. CG5]
MSGLLIAAPSSAAGKTTVTLGLLRALKTKGFAIAPGKAGPDYIDPAFHAAASGEVCLNFDPWGMRPELLLANAALHMSGGKVLVIEAMMGLFDGAADGTGSAADLATILGLSVVLVVDCARASHSIAALVSGFANFRVDTRIVGVILNRVGSDRHEAMLRGALAGIRMPVFAVIRADKSLSLPERHLGLVQAGEHAELDAFIDRAAEIVAADCDLDALMRTARHIPARASDANIDRLPPLGQKIAVARDLAFAFSYEHMLLGWRRRGAEISFFSPLADEAPAADADAVYLPGGYPELHAETISAAANFRHGMVAARDRGARMFGECGGYMVMGDSLVDAKGRAHAMLGLLPLTTSFETRRRQLGYRRLKPVDGSFFASPINGHEFHYATIVSEGAGDRLFKVEDALGTSLGSFGLRHGNVAGSFMHLIDLAASAG